MMKNWLIFAVLIGISGCSSIPKPLSTNLGDRDRAVSSCAEFLQSTEEAAAKTSTVDAEANRIEGYPYLRVNRFLAGLREDLTEATFGDWVDRLQRLAIEGWQKELMNLPAPEQSRLEARAKSVDTSAPALIDVLQECGTRLRRNDLDAPQKREHLKNQAGVPADYLAWRQIAGLYPLTAVPMRLGIARWHQTTLESYKQPLETLPVKGRLLRYAPETWKASTSTEAIARIIKQASDNPLAIPEPNADQQRLLFDRFAPIFEIDTASDNDRIGPPVLTRENTVQIDVSRPTVYRKLSHAQVGLYNLLQLNYMIWFPSRPKQSAFDILGGHLDGIIWRVTLLPNGQPWIYDSIHLCGCYHLFFPTRFAQTRKLSISWVEPDFMPQANLLFNEAARAIVRIAANSHYIDRVYFSATAGYETIVYQWSDADHLRSLPAATGRRRSLFSEEGLVAGTERNERFLFWPMGIANPGAMRQWGHHATAFVGRRHFDDPRLFERFFELPVIHK